MKQLVILFLVGTLITSAGCSARLIDFTVISSKNTGMRAPNGKATKGKSMGFLGFGVSIKDAMDDALSNAGRGYDVLIDGVVRQKAYPFFSGFTVEGTAVKSEELKITMSKEEYDMWFAEHATTPESIVMEAGE